MNRFPPSRILLALAVSVASVSALAIDSIPLDQLRPGLWKVERKMEKLDLNPVEYETRNSEYCASPKKELTRMLRAASMLCKSTITALADNKYQVQARCNLPGVTGSNTTIITIVSADEYRADVDTEGSVFGKQQHRKEQISASRAGDCTE
ncbi:MAG: DUF3617 family protein [Rhizobacter sp.]|nr:DUF3617 family protein [Burkholderiales bacterium]